MAARAPALEKKPSGRVLAPPIFHLAGTAELQDGDHTHDCWHARVVHETLANHSLPMIVKAMPSQVGLAIELACGLAARELRVSVPQPGLVLADRDDLPGIRPSVRGKRILLVGSHYQERDALFAGAVEDEAAEEMVWRSVCSSPAACQGGAWDELIANPDRHCENLLFDGKTWWLFDHDQALAPANDFTRNEQDARTRQDAIAHVAAANGLVHEFLTRHLGQHLAVLQQTRKLDGGKKRLHALSVYARHWTHSDTGIQQVLQLSAVVLGLIHLRLPALAEQLARRTGAYS